MRFWPGNNSDWLSVDNGDIRVHRLGGVSLEVCGQEEGCLDIFLECDTIVHHVDVTDHRNRHAQVSTCTPTTRHNEITLQSTAETTTGAGVDGQGMRT